MQTTLRPHRVPPQLTQNHAFEISLSRIHNGRSSRNGWNGWKGRAARNGRNGRPGQNCLAEWNGRTVGTAGPIGTILSSDSPILSKNPLKQLSVAILAQAPA